MKKIYKSLLTCFCLTAALTAGSMMTAWADESGPSGTVRIRGPITKTESQSLILDNQADVSYKGEIIINISDDTRILDAVTGFPVSFDQLKDGETVYAYIGPAMALSLPPMTNTSLILCNIPADYRVPEYLQTDQLTVNADGVSGSVTATNGTTYTIPAGTSIIPYLTRNMVYIQDLTKDRTFLLWSNNQNQASKIVIFPQSSTAGSDGSIKKQGWSQIDTHWFYYDASGNPATGWQLINGDWYYLDPATGIMLTGFLTLDGKTYYLQPDGRMLTKAKTFTPDESGVLH